MRKLVSVDKVAVQPRTQAADRIVDALAEIWNASAQDRTAWAYFYAVTASRGEMLYGSLARYPERDQKLLARKLLELADAIYGAVGPLI